MSKFVCTINPKHEYTAEEALKADYWCKKCPTYTGALEEMPIPIISNGSGPVEPVIPTFKEVALCVLLMDASGSMWKEFPGSKQSKKEMVIAAAASAIFSLKTLSDDNLESAYLFAYAFDHEVVPLFHKKTIGEVIREYKTVENLAQFFRTEFEKRQGATDINGALTAAYSMVKQFTEKTFPGWNNYEVLKRPVLFRSGTSKRVSNTRVFLYTDGFQWHNQKSDPIVNPFKNHPDCDILMSAFIGKSTDDGYSQLLNIAGTCPKHGIQQFFLMDDVKKYGSIRGLFRMSSGGSGFCPDCLAEYMVVNKDV